MTRITMAAVIFLMTTGPALASPCNGVDLAVHAVSVKNVSASGNANRYELGGVVTNVGSSSQGADALQSVDVYEGKEKLDSRSIPPLKVGESHSFSYAFERSTGAGNGTTHLRFQLNITHPSPADAQSCNMSNDSYTLTF
jgi:hypothetical protein